MKFFVLASVIAGVSCSPAYAQRNCAPVSVVQDRLSKKYGEELQSTGLANHSQVIEVWGNEESGTWTIISVTPNGVSCLLASGNSFERVQLKAQL